MTRECASKACTQHRPCSAPVQTARQQAQATYVKPSGTWNFSLGFAHDSEVTPRLLVATLS